jgi:hypothetical protein
MGACESSEHRMNHDESAEERAARKKFHGGWKTQRPQPPSSWRLGICCFAEGSLLILHSGAVGGGSVSIRA